MLKCSVGCGMWKTCNGNKDTACLRVLRIWLNKETNVFLWRCYKYENTPLLITLPVILRSISYENTSLLSWRTFLEQHETIHTLR